jgi:predicted lipoprotein with Yx(FWY)xxD motif
MNRTRTTFAAAALAAVTMLVALASSAAADGGWGSTPAPAAKSAHSATAVSVKTAKTHAGTILVASNGFTLYMFTADSKNKDTCVKHTGCTSVWPPYTVTAKPTAGTGVKASLLGTIKLSSGKLQVTYNGHPLYRYAADSSPAATDYFGATAFGGTWYGITASGATVK